MGKRIAWMWWQLRLAVKGLVCRAGFGSALVEYCSVCGIRQPLVWWSPDGLWTELTGAQPVKGDNMPGILCPACFDRRAKARGLILRWHPEVAHRLAGAADA